MSICDHDRAYYFSQLMPSFIKNDINKEMETWKARIMEKLPSCIEKQSNQEIEFWFYMLDMYTSFETYVFSVQELEKIGILLYNFVINCKNYPLVMNAASLFISLIEPRKTKINLVLEWRPLYKILYETIISKSKTNITKYPSKISETIINLVRISRNYWPESATEEMIAEWAHLLDPHNQTFALGEALLSIFLPVQHGKHGLWIDLLLRTWTYFRSVTFDIPFFEVFGRLCRYNYSDIDWNNILPFIFNVAAVHFGIPSSLLESNLSFVLDFHPEQYSSLFKDSNSLEDLISLFCVIIVHLLSGETKSLARTLLEKFIFILTPYCSAVFQGENETKSQTPMIFVEELIAKYTKRVKTDKKYGSFRELLNDEDHEWFVSLLVPLVAMIQFQEDPVLSSVSKFVQLCPRIAIPPLLDGANYSFNYEQLKPTALQTLIDLAIPVSYTKQSIEDYMALVLKTNEDISFMDIQKSSLVFSLLTLVSSVMAFSSEHEPFIISVATKCVEFAQHAIGEDYLMPLSDILTMFSVLVHAIPSRLATRIGNIIKSKMDDIPNDALLSLVEGLDSFAAVIFGEMAVKASSVKHFYVLKALVRQADQFFLPSFDTLQNTLLKGLAETDKKYVDVVVPTLKWTLKNLLCSYPIAPKKQGFVSIKKIQLDWHIPSENEITKAELLLSNVIPFIKSKIQSSNRTDQVHGVSVARAVIKGILSSVSSEDLSSIPDNPLFSRPSIKRFHDKRISTKYEEVLTILYEAISSSKTNRRALSQIFKVFELANSPRDTIALQVESLSNQWTYYSSHGRACVLCNIFEPMTYIALYWKAIHLYAMRNYLDYSLLTELNQKIFEKSFELSTYPFVKVQEAVASYIQLATSNYRYHFLEIFENAINRIEQNNLNLDELSGIADSLCAISSVMLTSQTYKLLMRAANAICIQLGADENLDSVRSLRQIIVVLIDQTDLSDSMFSDQNDFHKNRLWLAKEAIKKHALFPASRETQNYASALVCSVIIGNPILLSPEIIVFIFQLLKTDDKVVRDCVLSILPTIIEYLIPRVPRDNGVSFDTLTPNNYDAFMFIDRQMPTQAKNQPLFLTKEQSLDPKVLQLYFSEDQINERIEIHRFLFDFIVDNKETLDTFISNLVDSQIHKEETFSRGHVLFWCTLCRFFGMEFSVSLIDRIEELITPSSTLAHHVVSAGLFAGVIRSVKCRKFKDIEVLSPSVKKLVSRIIQQFEPEFHPIWHFAFFTCFNEMDPKRLFWLYDHILTCVPHDDSLRAARAVSLISDVLLDVSYRIPGLSQRIEAILEQVLFSPMSQSYEQIRDSSIRALISVISISFDCKTRGHNPESIRLLEKFTHANIVNDQFMIRLIVNAFTTQSLATLSAGEYAIQNLNKWCHLFLGKDEEEEKIARSGLLSLCVSNWIASSASLPLTVESARNVTNRVIEQLSQLSKAWQVQTVLVLLLESFLSSVIFFVEDPTLIDLIDKVIMPSFVYQHPDVQDAASELLTFIIKTAKSSLNIVNDLVNRFKRLLEDKDTVVRIAGAKGLCGIITGTLLFNDVPQYVIDCFQALTSAMEIDKVVEPVVSQFLSDFWAASEDNLLKSVAEILDPYRASLKPSYFC